MATSQNPRRDYHSPQRRAQAERTQQRVVAAARDLLTSKGWAAMTMAEVAREAGISSAMLYKICATKADLVKRAYDIALVGDQAEVAFRHRPEFVAVLEELDPAAKLRGYAGLMRTVAERVLPIYSQLVAAVTAGDGDDQLRELVATADAERLFGARGIVRDLQSVTPLSPTLEQAQAVDLVWMAMSPEFWALLVRGRSWSWDQAEQWVGDHLISTLTGQAPDSVHGTDGVDGRTGVRS